MFLAFLQDALSVRRLGVRERRLLCGGEATLIEVCISNGGAEGGRRHGSARKWRFGWFGDGHGGDSESELWSGSAGKHDEKPSLDNED